MKIETTFDFLMLIGLVTLAGLGADYLYVRFEIKRQKKSFYMVAAYSGERDRLFRRT